MSQHRKNFLREIASSVEGLANDRSDAMRKGYSLAIWLTMIIKSLVRKHEGSVTFSARPRVMSHGY